ncbi:hypothetical protein J3Q64DRAFT_1692973 [Phycomyces blakesleeanus]
MLSITSTRELFLQLFSEYKVSSFYVIVAPRSISTNRVRAAFSSLSIRHFLYTLISRVQKILLNDRNVVKELFVFRFFIKLIISCIITLSKMSTLLSNFIDICVLLAVSKVLSFRYYLLPAQVSRRVGCDYVRCGVETVDLENIRWLGMVVDSLGVSFLGKLTFLYSGPTRENARIISCTVLYGLYWRISLAVSCASVQTSWLCICAMWCGKYYSENIC